ncbi:hypothetical protein EFV37_35900 (plasmid) [Mesorhizobium loti]|uniref:Uncharacterized protein n=2 Tax=Mesorhizobium jarvisii TaxID=1777867 RepID=A0A6M7TRK3_9HYPH|nr:hypothetical protein A9K72_34615 [Mesorhizobium loti]QKC67661.1 hypothetical protein EB229_35880 [Mesorhizobium jarvisii]QKD13576.1 hypothetical protein EFV37_35900 [Mesorhizobium loti]RJT28185.1 hypothetical protein D3242_33000 [Mesorhizobium jarvisii]
MIMFFIIDNEGFQNMTERRAILLFVGFLTVIGLLLFLPQSYPLSTRIAAVGGFIAATGGLIIVSEVVLRGPFSWIANDAIDFALTGRPAEKSAKELQDERALQYVFGPFLIAVGTLINGFSGFVA